MVAAAIALLVELWLVALCDGRGPGRARPPERGALAVSASGPKGLLFGRPLDLNREPASTLEVLPGIGPRRAAAIVAAREERPFETVSDLVRVKGIGPATVARLSGLVCAGRACRAQGR